MIQFNLLPDIKRDYEKARRNKRLTFLMAGVAATVSLVVLVVAFVVVQVFQKNHSTDLSQDIKTESAKLQDTPDINKILTIQNQLNSLTGLHDKKPVATRLLEYLKQVTPSKVTIASLNTDFEVQSMVITGSADALSTINQFVDTLKFTTYQTVTENQADAKTGNAFSSVVLANFGKSSNNGASYQLTLKFDPVIFSGANDVKLLVPTGKITTRSETEKPEGIFQPLNNPSEIEGQ